MTPGTGSIERTDLYQLYNIVQNTSFAYCKDLIISILRDEFSKDSYYHYVADEWGFPKVIDHLNLPLGAGLNDDLTTRIFIGESFRHDAIFYPAIIVKSGGLSSVPIGLSRNKRTVEYEKQLLIDGYGNERKYFIPKYFDLAGAWEGSISIDIITRDILTRDDLSSLLMIIFTDIKFESLKNAGLVIKKVSSNPSGESDDRNQEKIYKQSVSLDIRTEWRRLIPIENIIDRVNFCIDFIAMDSTSPASPNLSINTYVELLNQINDL